MLRRALRAHESGELAQAERLYNALLRQDPDNFDVLHGLGLLHYQRGRLNTALTLIQSALRRVSGRRDGCATLGLAFHSMRRFKEALVSYDAGRRIEPANAELLNRRGVALLELNCPVEALESFECI